MITTDRLILRRWVDADRPVFHAHCSDPEVMEYLGGVKSRAETDAALERFNGYIDSHGYSFWAVERADDGALIGFCGIKPGAEGTPVEGEVEIGWRFARAFWGQGYAYEAARATLDWTWANLTADRVGSITVPANRRSWGLMERLGMVRDPNGDFDHPILPEGDPLRRHVLYWIFRPAGTGN